MYYAVDVIIAEIPRFLFGAIRFTVAGGLLLGWCVMRGEKIWNPPLIRKSFVSGLFLIFIDLVVIMLALKYVSSSLVAIIASSTALWIMALDFREWKTNFRQPFFAAGIILGFFGVLMLYVEQLQPDIIDSNGAVGVIILITGCISWALGTLYAKYRSGKEENVNDFGGTAWQMLLASLLFWICSLGSGEISATDFSSVSATAWYSLIYLITLGTVFAYSAYVWLLKVRPAGEVATHAYVNPFVAVALGVMLGGEHVTILQIIGLCLILASITMIGKRQKTS
jgi:drug/metabolite transporter (DMT)-like permease